MDIYALIKYDGKTSKITGDQVRQIIDRAIKYSMLNTLNEIIKKYGNNHIVTPRDINSFSSGICSNLAERYLKQLIDYEDYYYSFEYSEFKASELKAFVLDYPIHMDINIENFDYVLKELGVIHVDNSNITDSSIHKCGNCTKMSPLICEKVEYIKKPIFQYDFVVDGYQTYYFEDGEERLDKFIVQRCRQYKKVTTPVMYYSKPKVLTKE